MRPAPGSAIPATSPRPKLKPTWVTLAISDDPAFLPRFGQRVLRTGGRYTTPNGHKNRMVTLPGGNEALVDAIAEAFALGRMRIFVTRWTVEGFGEPLQEALSDPENLEVSWDRSPGVTASQAVEAKGRAVSAAFDWKAYVERHAGRRTPPPTPVAPVRDGIPATNPVGSTLRDIGEEALRILDGETDLDVLKALAARYRRLRGLAGAPHGGLAGPGADDTDRAVPR